jgi:hypothetical protein
MIEHKVMVSFFASRPLTADEMCDIEGALAAQVEEPMVHNEVGDYVDADFDVSNVEINFLIAGINAPID